MAARQAVFQEAMQVLQQNGEQQAYPAEAGQSDKHAGAPIKNFRAVTDWLFRGGQPDPEGIRFLKDLDVRTVISLRWNPWVVQAEREIIEAAGMSYESIPLSYWSWPSDQQVRKFFSIVDDPERRPVFVHCLHGSDRTGMLIAMYRMAREGWDVDSAYAEMRACGFHRLPVYHFKWAVYYYARKLTTLTRWWSDDTNDK